MDSTTPKKPGRPPKGDKPLSVNQRAAAYRARRAMAASEAGADIPGATSRQLIDRLSRLLNRIEADPTCDYQGMAASCWSEIAKRYNIV